jgi:phosphoserine aminotransferase
MASATKPGIRPANPRFSSGPCAKRPGWSLAALEGALLGRSHRAATPKAKLAEHDTTLLLEYLLAAHHVTAE